LSETEKKSKSKEMEEVLMETLFGLMNKANKDITHLPMEPGETTESIQTTFDWEIDCVN